MSSTNLGKNKTWLQEIGQIFVGGQHRLLSTGLQNCHGISLPKDLADTHWLLKTMYGESSRGVIALSTEKGTEAQIISTNWAR